MLHSLRQPDTPSHAEARCSSEHRQCISAARFRHALPRSTVSAARSPSTERRRGPRRFGGSNAERNAGSGARQRKTGRRRRRRRRREICRPGTTYTPEDLPTVRSFDHFEFVVGWTDHRFKRGGRIRLHDSPGNNHTHQSTRPARADRPRRLLQKTLDQDDPVEDHITRPHDRRSVPQRASMQRVLHDPRRDGVPRDLRPTHRTRSRAAARASTGDQCVQLTTQRPSSSSSWTTHSAR